MAHGSEHYIRLGRRKGLGMIMGMGTILLIPMDGTGGNSYCLWG